MSVYSYFDTLYMEDPINTNDAFDHDTLKLESLLHSIVVVGYYLTLAIP